MFCKACGTMLEDDQKFCPECGANIADPDNSGSAPRYSASRKSQYPTYDDESEYPEKPITKPPKRHKRPVYREQREHQEPKRIIIEHARKRGDDISTGFGRSFGSTIGEKAGGCVWSLFITGIIIIVIIIIALSLH